MNNKKIAIIQLILVPIFLATLFMEIFHQYSGYPGNYNTYPSRNFYYESLNSKCDFGPLFLLILVALVIAFIALTFKSIRLESSDSLSTRKMIITYLLPLLMLFDFVAFLLIESGKYMGNYIVYYSGEITFPIIAISLIIILCAVDFLLKVKKNPKQKKVYKVEIQNNHEQNVESKADYMVELRELKKLLDEGIITQDEFDSKKKQLLNL